jgi:hypothetical protein
MSDNKNKTGHPDKLRVSATDAYEVSYLRRKFPELTRQAIIAAITRKGPMRKNIMEYIRLRWYS